LARLAVTLLLAVLLSGCFTGALWGFTPEEECDAYGNQETSLEYDHDTKWSWGLVAIRIVATPFTLLLDVLTSPVQACAFCQDVDKDEEDCNPDPRQAELRPNRKYKH
jgi:uncharacterized protein YceK